MRDLPLNVETYEWFSVFFFCWRACLLDHLKPKELGCGSGLPSLCALALGEESFDVLSTISNSILLLEEILHHPTCMKPCKNNGKFYHINWWSPDFWTINSTKEGLNICHVLKQEIRMGWSQVQVVQHISQQILARMIFQFFRISDMFFKKKEYQKRSLESARERVLARNAQLEVALSRWLFSKEGPPLDFSISKHTARNHSPQKKLKSTT